MLAVKRVARERDVAARIKIGDRVRVIDPDAAGIGYDAMDEGVVWRLCRDELDQLCGVQVEWTRKRASYQMQTLYLWEFQIIERTTLRKILDWFIVRSINSKMKVSP